MNLSTNLILVFIVIDVVVIGYIIRILPYNEKIRNCKQRLKEVNYNYAYSYHRILGKIQDKVTRSDYGFNFPHTPYSGADTHSLVNDIYLTNRYWIEEHTDYSLDEYWMTKLQSDCKKAASGNGSNVPIRSTFVLLCHDCIMVKGKPVLLLGDCFDTYYSQPLKGYTESKAMRFKDCLFIADIEFVDISNKKILIHSLRTTIFNKEGVQPKYLFPNHLKFGRKIRFSH